MIFSFPPSLFLSFVRIVSLVYLGIRATQEKENRLTNVKNVLFWKKFYFENNSSRYNCSSLYFDVCDFVHFNVL